MSVLGWVIYADVLASVAVVLFTLAGRCLIDWDQGQRCDAVRRRLLGLSANDPRTRSLGPR